jgi:hypothetical protein
MPPSLTQPRGWPQASGVGGLTRQDRTPEQGNTHSNAPHVWEVQSLLRRRLRGQAKAKATSTRRKFERYPRYCGLLLLCRRCLPLRPLILQRLNAHRRLALRLVDDDPGLSPLIPHVRLVVGPLDLHLGLVLRLLHHDLRLGWLDLHLRRLLGLHDLYLRLRLVDLNLGLGHRDVHVRLRHAHDDLRLRDVHRDRRLRLANQDLRLSLAHGHLRLRLLHRHLGRRLIHAHARRRLLDDDPRRIRATLALSRRRLAGLRRLRASSGRMIGWSVSPVSRSC